jgi:hypothetical protein
MVTRVHSRVILVVNCGFQGKRLHRIVFGIISLFIILFFTGLFADEEIKITTEAEEGGGNTSTQYYDSTCKHDFMISCFNHPKISGLIKFE